MIGPFESIVAAGDTPSNGSADRREGKAGRLITIGNASGFRQASDAIEED